MLKISKLNAGYEQDKQIINDLNLEVEAKTFNAIVGKNGSGKSTLCKLIACVIPADSGEISLNGQKVTNLDVAIVFQNPTDQFVRPNVYQDLAFGLENLNTSLEQIDIQIKQMAEVFGVSHLLDRSVNSLSGGEKQRIAIISNLLLAPKILILDEATDMLDPITRHNLLININDFAKKNNIIVMYITHDMNLAASLERMIVIEEGQVVANDYPANIFANPQIMKTSRLRAPYGSLLNERLSGSYQMLESSEFGEKYELKTD